MKKRVSLLANQSQISRREFLNLSGLGLASIFVPHKNLRFSTNPISFSSYQFAKLPEYVKNIIAHMPSFEVNNAGRLISRSPDGNNKMVPLIPTEWNLDRRKTIDRLESGQRWGIVLHWFGDNQAENITLDGYLRGFNAIRPVFNYLTRTSSHFLINDTNLNEVQDIYRDFAIVQTQEADIDGTPFLASHLQALNYEGHKEKKQYFVRAFYELGYTEPGSNSLLQEMFDSPLVIDPNLRTIAIEITGSNFDIPGSEPGIQKIANTLAVVWALMKRYRVRALDVLGHNEIQLGKADPGKKFAAMIRYLLGVVALTDPDPVGWELVFGGFQNEDNDPLQTVGRYFKFIRDYLVLTATPLEVYQWEAKYKFWPVYDVLMEKSPRHKSSNQFFLPFLTATLAGTNRFLIPYNHEGVDLYATEDSIPIRTITNGECLKIGTSEEPHWGNYAVFRHRQPDGADIVAIYSHLAELPIIEEGTQYPARFAFGSIRRANAYQPTYLHFSIAYSASWEIDLHETIFPPGNAGAEWIFPRYIDPIKLIDKFSEPPPPAYKKYERK